MPLNPDPTVVQRTASLLARALSVASEVHNITSWEPSDEERFGFALGLLTGQAFEEPPAVRTLVSGLCQHYVDAGMSWTELLREVREFAARMGQPAPV